jgi:hypothetical protein
MLREAAAHPGTAVEKLGYLVEQYLVFCQEQGAFFAVLISILRHSGDACLEELGFDMPAIGTAFRRHPMTILIQQTLSKQSTICQHISWHYLSHPLREIMSANALMYDLTRLDTLL